MASLRRSARLIVGSAASSSPNPPSGTVPLRKRKTDATPAKTTKRQTRARPKTPEPEPEPEPADPDTVEPPPTKRRGRPATKPAPAPVTPPRRVAPPSTPRGRPRHGAVARLADPERTLAPLLSPETSRVVSVLPQDAPTPSLLAHTTTDNILEKACAHLIGVDARMAPLIAAHPCTVFSPAGLAEPVDPFESLASSIISQQVSGAAARAIRGRFVALWPAPGAGEKGAAWFPQPSQVAAAGIERLRSAGLSQRKAEYVQGLAAHFVSGALSAQLLAEAPYETLVERLVAVRGIGRWSAEMFALFGLKRMDVFSVGDLGIQRGMAAFAGRDVAKLKRSGSGSTGAKAKWKYMTEQEMEAMAEPFRPYRSVFMWYMWQAGDTDVSTLA